LAAIPVASASSPECLVVVTLVTGQKLYFHLPPGVSPKTLNLPPGVVKITKTCPKIPPSTTPSTPTNPPPRTTPSSPTKTNPGSSRKKHSGPPPHKPPPKSSGGGHSKSPGSSSPHHSSPGSSHHHSGPGGSHPKVPNKKPPPPRGPGGVPTPTNPSYSYALPNPSPLGVPNFFIDNFAIPPFLLPIYQAAGIQYDVPWQILAAINEIETDYGRNLSVSSAGAVGWMQFLPSTWKMWGVDATGSGYADPYNPVDAIFAAARYLNAAGASKNLPRAIYAYNHAWWYVQSVLLRAKLIGGMPNSLVSALTGLVEGHFPVAAPARYADDYVEQLAQKHVKRGNAAIPIDSNPKEKAIAIYAKQGSPVIAVNDGKVIGMGKNKQWGRYLELQDANGNVYVYANLGQVPKQYPVPKPVPISAAGIVKALVTPSSPKKPTAPATAGSQNQPQVSAPATAGSHRGSGSSKPARGSSRAHPTSEAQLQLPSLPVAPQSTSSSNTTATPAYQRQGLLPASLAEPAPQVKQRLFAYPSRAASYAAGGDIQLRSETQGQQIQSFENYFSGVLHLAKDQYTLKPLKPGAVLVAGTILGRVNSGTRQQASHLEFMIRPAGKNAPYIDPKPILDGWELLQATSIYRASGLDPFVGKDPSIGQILLMSKQQLEERVLSDPRIQIYACGRRDIATGQIDRRILGAIEFLSASGLKPYISGLKCGWTATGSNGIDPAGQTGASMDISKINNIPIKGHQGPGSITDLTIRRLLTLQGVFKPTEIVSTMSYKGQSNTLALPDHSNRLQVSYTDMFGPNSKLSQALASILKPGQWIQLIQRLGQIPEPTVPINPSKYAIKRPG
jgi:hypothetical protein